MRGLLFLPVLLLLIAVPAFAVNYGLLANLTIEADNELTTYSPNLTPWFSWNGGEGLSVYLSGIFTFKYNDYTGDMTDSSGWIKSILLPEAGLFALNYRPAPGFSFQMGRIKYEDALGFAAHGLFDGLSFEAALPVGSISVGAFYTGLLYKETAEILMTQDDRQKYADPWDWGNFSPYFASRRALAAIRWDLPFFEYHRLSVETLAQLDLNPGNQTLNSQYGTIMAKFFTGRIALSIGGIFELMETGEGNTSAAFGALTRLMVQLPGSFNHGFSLTGKYTSGDWNSAFKAFTPLSCTAQGMVFPGTLSGLAMVSADYSARLFSALYTEASLRYFIRTYEEPENRNYLYGGELWTFLAWQPLDDMRFSAGGGAYFPGLGNVEPDADIMWKLSVSMSVSF